MTIRDQIVTALYVKVPLPAFLEKEIQLPADFGKTLRSSSIWKGFSEVMGKLGIHSEMHGIALRPKQAKKAVPAIKHDSSFQLEGRLSVGSNGWYFVNGEAFLVDEQTWILGELKNGNNVRVRGTTVNGEKRIATKISSGF